MTQTLVISFRESFPLILSCSFLTIFIEFANAVGDYIFPLKMLSISENCENSLFLFLANLGICLLCVCVCVCFF